MKCPYCGKEVSDKASSCEFCGKSFDVNSLVSDLLNGSGKSDAVNLSPEVTAGAAVAAQEIKKEAGKAKAEKAVKEPKKPAKREKEFQVNQGAVKPADQDKKSKAPAIIAAICLILAAAAVVVFVLPKLKGDANRNKTPETESQDTQQVETVTPSTEPEDTQTTPTEPAEPTQTQQQTTPEETQPAEPAGQDSETKPADTQQETKPEQTQEPQTSQDNTNTATEQAPATESTDTSQTQSTDPDSSMLFMLPFSNRYYYSYSDMTGFNEYQLNVAENEIYARHGMIFSDQSLINYFSACPWYSGTVSAGSFDYSVLNDYERSNLALIEQRQIDLGYKAGTPSSSGSSDSSSDSSATESPDSSMLFMLPYSNSYYYKYDDLLGFNEYQLMIARNEIYARHGWIFSDETLRKYFESMPWYTGTTPGASFDYSVMNDYEIANVKLIVQRENDIG